MTACAEAGIPCHVLERRSIENYFPETAVRRVLGPGARALGRYETPNDGGWSAFSYSKRTHNWQIADTMTLNDIDGDLREVLKSL